MASAGTTSDAAGTGLEALLGEAVEVLSRLDADRVEALVELAERMASGPGPGPASWPRTAEQWRRAAASHWVLGHLVGATARQLAVQRRISRSGGEFREYRLEGDPRLAARMNAVLAWPWGRAAERRGGGLEASPESGGEA